MCISESTNTLLTLDFGYNYHITYISAGTFPIPNRPVDYRLDVDGIQHISPGAFVLPSERGAVNPSLSSVSFLSHFMKSFYFFNCSPMASVN